MADLGAVGRLLTASYENIAGPKHVTLVVHNIVPVAQNGTLGGSVFDGANPVAGARVLVVLAKTLELVAVAYTDANGDWSVGGLCPSIGGVYAAIAQDPVTGTVYNDLIYTGLTAVSP